MVRLGALHDPAVENRRWLIGGLLRGFRETLLTFWTPYPWLGSGAAAGRRMPSVSTLKASGSATFARAARASMTVSWYTAPFETGGRPPLTDFGRTVLDKLVLLNMIVDVTHCAPEAREAVLMHLDRTTPVVASHVGGRALKADPYNLADSEMREIAATGGVIGVIFMSHWLAEPGPEEGLESIWATMAHVREITGCWEHVVVGSDFDGFTDPPDDLMNASQLGALSRLLLDRGVSEENVKKILGRNALRVLRSG